MGSSTNGGAFGGTVSIKTGKASEDFKLKYSSSAGSYKSFKNTLELNSGLIKNKINMNLRLSKINSDGYVDRATSDLKSYYASASYYSDKTSIDLINFSGKERTYQSWWGTPEGRINNDIEEMNNVIANNGYSDEQADNLLSSGEHLITIHMIIRLIIINKITTKCILTMIYQIQLIYIWLFTILTEGDITKNLEKMIIYLITMTF